MKTLVLLRPPDPMGMVDVLSHVLPTNLGYIAAYAQKDGFEVEIWDYEQEYFRASEFAVRVRQTDPAIIGISCMTPTIVNGAKIAEVVKKLFPDIITIVGGAHSSAIPEDTLRDFSGFDLVVNQEGEATFLEVARAVRCGDRPRGIQGTTWRDGGEIVREEGRGFIRHLDDIPFPARELYHRNQLAHGHSTRGFSSKINTTEIFTSRGCPYKCTFCAIVATFERTVRYRTPENVFAEVDDVQKRFGVNHVIVADDTFGLFPGRIEALCDGFSQLSLNSWSCDTRIDCVDKDILKKMSKSGCTKVAFGVETGSKRLVKLNEKRINLDQVEPIVRYAQEAGIKHVECNFIVGSHPDETLEDLEQTAALIRRLPLTFVSISVTVPYPGTPNFELMEKNNQIYAKDWSRFVMFGQSPAWRTNHFESDDLLAHQRRLNRMFYLNVGYLMRTLASIRSTRDLVYYAKAGRAFFKWVLGGPVIPDRPVMELSKTG